MKQSLLLSASFLIATLFSNAALFGQAQSQNYCSNRVSFVTRIKGEQATKDGAYIHGYVVEISPTEFQKLVGKKVRISGEVIEAEGVNNQEGSEVVQGRSGSFKYIQSPGIEVLGNKRKKAQ